MKDFPTLPTAKVLERVRVKPEERDADEDHDDGEGGGAGEPQQATEKDKDLKVHLATETGEPIHFTYKNYTWKKVGTPSPPTNQHGAVENETGAPAPPPVVTPEAAQGVSPDSNVSTNGAVTLQTVVQDRAQSRVGPSITPLAPAAWRHRSQQLRKQRRKVRKISTSPPPKGDIAILIAAPGPQTQTF